MDSHDDLAELYEGAQHLSRLQEEIRELEVEVSSPDGSVTVAVDAFGKVLGIRIKRSENGLKDDRALEQTLLSALQTAQRAATSAMEEAVGSTFPDIRREVFDQSSLR